MISIIISSYQPDYFRALEKNIAETVGVEYEVIKIENPGLMGICEAYNKGAEQANYEYLLFVHEDVKFHTPDWGKKLINHLNDPETGLIGVAGSDYVPVAPASWAITSVKHLFINIIQNSQDGNSAILLKRINNDKHKAYALDGVFLAIHKAKFNQFGFSKRLKGFHAYDTEISLNVAKKYSNFVIGDILIEHFSPGAPDKFWLSGNILVRKQHGYNFVHIKDSEIELACFNQYLFNLFKYNGISFSSVLTSLQFLPLNYINLNQKIKILRKFFHYFINKHKYKTRFSSHT